MWILRDCDLERLLNITNNNININVVKKNINKPVKFLFKNQKEYSSYNGFKKWITKYKDIINRLIYINLDWIIK